MLNNDEPEERPEAVPTSSPKEPVQPVRDRRREVIGALIDALPDDSNDEPSAPEKEETGLPAQSSSLNDEKSNSDTIPTAAELFALTAESIEPSVAPVAILAEAEEIEVEHPGNKPLNQPQTDTYEQPDPHAVINRLISTATSQGALIAQQRQLLAASLTHLPENLANEVRSCLADSVLGQTDPEEDLIVIEDVAEAP